MFKKALIFSIMILYSIRSGNRLVVFNHIKSSIGRKKGAIMNIIQKYIKVFLVLFVLVATVPAALGMQKPILRIKDGGGDPFFSHITLFIRLLNPVDGKMRFPINVSYDRENRTFNTADFYQEISDVLGYEQDDIRVSFKGRQIIPNQTFSLSDLNQHGQQSEFNVIIKAYAERREPN